MDVVLVKMLLRNVELVGCIAVEGFEHFVIEVVLLVFLHEASSQFQAAACHFVSLLTAHDGKVGIVLNLFASNESNGEEEQKRNEVGKQITPRGQTVVVVIF